MALKHSQAVVLRVADHGESDKLVTFLSPSAGRLVAIAKGAKRSRRRFVNKLEPFSWLEITYDQKPHAGLARVDEAELLASFPSLRERYERYVTASLLCELVLLWTRENLVDDELFPLLLWGLQRLEAGLAPPLVAVLFQIRFFAVMGYRPRFDGCLECGAAPGDGFCFQIRHSALCCSRCQPAAAAGAGNHRLPLAAPTLKLLAYSLELPLDRLDRLRFSRASLREGLQLCRLYGQQLLGREVHSWRSFEDFLRRDGGQSR